MLQDARALQGLEHSLGSAQVPDDPSSSSPIQQLWLYHCHGKPRRAVPQQETPAALQPLLARGPGVKEESGKVCPRPIHCAVFMGTCKVLLWRLPAGSQQHPALVSAAAGTQNWLAVTRLYCFPALSQAFAGRRHSKEPSGHPSEDSCLPSSQVLLSASL